MVHGGLKANEKEKRLKAFLKCEKKLLIATSVIEVGINVPDATIMIIEDANHFGLAQLHQLRGRVGRGDKAANCLLLCHPENLTEHALKRLKVLRDTNDGFAIAEADLKIRGSGDLIGVKQSGTPQFKFADIRSHFEYLKKTQKLAKILINLEPNLSHEKNYRYALLLKIFNGINKEKQS